MVYSYNNVSFNGGISYTAQDIQNLAKYATGVALTNKNDLNIGDILMSTGSNLAIQGGSWLFENRKDLKGGFEALKNAAGSTKGATEVTAKASNGILSKIGGLIGKTKVGQAISGLVAKSPALSKCSKALKAQGGGMMLLLEGGVEFITNVIPTFKQLGAKSGAKQLGKSAVKTAASVGGWVAGATVGTKLGATIGSFIPGAGTAIGAVLGGAIGTACSLIGGSLGSRLAKKGAEKVVGKDELVLAQEQQAETLAQVAQTDSTTLAQLTEAATERLQEEGADSEDAKIAFQSLARIQNQTTTTDDYSTATADTTSTTASTSATTTNPFLAYTTDLSAFNTYKQDNDLMAQSVGLTY